MKYELTSTNIVTINDSFYDALHDSKLCERIAYSIISSIAHQGNKTCLDKLNPNYNPTISLEDITSLVKIDMITLARHGYITNETRFVTTVNNKEYTSDYTDNLIFNDFIIKKVTKTATEYILFNPWRYIRNTIYSTLYHEKIDNTYCLEQDFYNNDNIVRLKVDDIEQLAKIYSVDGLKTTINDDFWQEVFKALKADKKYYKKACQLIEYRLQGKTQKATAESMNISIQELRTIQIHMKKAYKKACTIEKIKDDEIKKGNTSEYKATNYNSIIGHDISDIIPTQTPKRQEYIEKDITKIYISFYDNAQEEMMRQEKERKKKAQEKYDKMVKHMLETWLTYDEKQQAEKTKQAIRKKQSDAHKKRMKKIEKIERNKERQKKEEQRKEEQRKQYDKMVKHMLDEWLYSINDDIFVSYSKPKRYIIGKARKNYDKTVAFMLQSWNDEPYHTPSKTYRIGAVNY